MKKIVILAITISITLSTVGCNLSNQEKNSSNIVDTKQEDNLDSTQQSSDKENNNNTKNDDTITNKTDRKDYYLKKLNDIQVKIDKNYNFEDAKTTYDMREVSGAQYKMWDDALNEIYNELQRTLPSSHMEKLKEEELAWIAQKERDAKNAADQVKGGTQEPVNYSLSLVDSTKKRCYELVNNYFK